MVQATGHLLHVSFTKPLSAILTNHWNSLKFSSSNSDHLYRDIWDGSFMKTMNHESSNNKKIISLLTSTDGIPVFKSSTVSLWPVSFIINYHLLFVWIQRILFLLDSGLDVSLQRNFWNFCWSQFSRVLIIYHHQVYILKHVMILSMSLWVGYGNFWSTSQGCGS